MEGLKKRASILQNILKVIFFMENVCILRLILKFHWSLHLSLHSDDYKVEKLFLFVYDFKFIFA